MVRILRVKQTKFTLFYDQNENSNGFDATDFTVQIRNTLNRACQQHSRNVILAIISLEFPEIFSHNLILCYH